MPNKQTSQVNILNIESKLFETFRDVINTTNINSLISYILLTFYVLPFLAYLVLYEDSIFAADIPSNMITVIRLLLPHKLLRHVDFMYIAILFGFTVALVLLYILLLILTLFKCKIINVARFYGFTSYLVNYGLFLSISSLFIGILVLGTNENLAIDISFRIVSGIIIILFFFLVAIDSELMVSYYLVSKNSLRRCPEFKILYVKCIGIALILFDCAFSNSLNSDMIVIIHFIMSSTFFFVLISQTPFYDNSVLLFAIYIFFIYLWFTIVLLIAEVFQLTMIIKGYLILVILGLTFASWTVYRYRNYLRLKLFQKNIQDLQTPLEADKLLRYFCKLVDNAKKSKVDDIILAANIQLHFQNCTDVECVCKNRKLAFDPITGQYTDMSNMPFKDPIFLKNIIQTLAKRSLEKFKDSRLVHLNYILVQLEILGNVPQATTALVEFESKFKGQINIFYRFAIRNSRAFIDKLLGRIHVREKHSKVMYENIKKYDKTMQILR